MAVIGNVSLNDFKISSDINKTSSSDHCISEVSPSQVTITIHAFTLLSALIGNCLLIAAFARTKKAEALLLIANMAASDLLVAIFLLPRYITKEIIGSNAFLVHGSGGTFLCKMCSFLSDISLSVSTLSASKQLCILYCIGKPPLKDAAFSSLQLGSWPQRFTRHIFTPFD